MAESAGASAPISDSGSDFRADFKAQTELIVTTGDRNPSSGRSDAGGGTRYRSSRAGSHPFDSSSQRGVSEADYTAALQVERNAVGEGISVYVHLPFCPSRCLTCDHQTSVSHDFRQIDRYLDAIEREVALVVGHLGPGHRLEQLHLGGGTPNYLSEVQLARLVDIVEGSFCIDDMTEMSLEANAHRASVSQLALLQGLGFRGLKLEVRDLDAGVQQALGRRQSTSVIQDVIENARGLGFESVAMDLVYGLPTQSVESMRATIDKLVELDPDRVSCMTYARRPEQFSHHCAVDEGQLPSLADKVAIFSRIIEGLGGAGYDWIGLDCFAKPHDVLSRAHRDGALRRNWIGYTAQQGRRVLGFGSSSASNLSTISVRNHTDVTSWRDCLERDELPVGTGAILAPEHRAQRHALSDLICNLQLKDAEHSLRDGSSQDPMLQSLRDSGLVEVDGDRVNVTAAGRSTLHQLWGDASPSHRLAGLV